MALKYRHGIELSRKTMGNWMFLIADWLTLIYEALRNEIRQSEYMQIDETFIKYQDPQKDHCPNGYLWGYNSPGVGVLFEWFPSRAAECLDPMQTGYTGLMQTDGYGGYTSWLDTRPLVRRPKTNGIAVVNGVIEKTHTTGFSACASFPHRSGMHNKKTRRKGRV